MPSTGDVVYEFRPPWSHVGIAVGSLVGFLAVGGLWAWAAAADPDGSLHDSRELPTLAVIGVVVAYIAYRIRLAVVSRLQFYPDRLRIVGGFRTREVALADLDTATWRNADTWLVLRAGRRQIGLGVFAYGDAAGRDLREMLRAVIPAAVQRGWLGERSQRLRACQEHLARELVRWYAPALALILLSQVLPESVATLSDGLLTLAGGLVLFSTVWGTSFGPPTAVASQEPA